MSAAYEYRKVYADCVTADGEVFVVYLNYVRLAGVWSPRASVEWYTPDGRRRLVHGAGRPALVDGGTAVGDLPLAVELPGERFHLVLTTRLGAWDPPVPPPVPPLTWGVRAARTDAVVTWGDRVVHGTGYVDFVQITRPTRLLGLHTLRWGRVHLPDRTVVLEHLDTIDGRVWDSGFEWPLHGAPFPLAPAAFAADGAARVELSDGPLTLAPLRVLHDGDAFDAERVPRRVDRWACEVFGGATHETRWYGTARHGDATVTALYESVHFGGAS